MDLLETKRTLFYLTTVVSYCRLASLVRFSRNSTRIERTVGETRCVPANRRLFHHFWMR